MAIVKCCKYCEWYNIEQKKYIENVGWVGWCDERKELRNPFAPICKKFDESWEDNKDE